MKLELKELAQSLQLPPDTIDRWIRQGRIPVKRTDNLCDFKVDVLAAWALKHRIRFNLTNLSDASRISSDSVQKLPEEASLLSATTLGGVHKGIEGNTVEAVLKQAVERVPVFSDSEKGFLFEKLMEREHLTSTGIGKGVAIPHPRNPLPEFPNEAMIITCFLNNKIDFNSIDHKPVGVLFVMVCPTVKTHLSLLSRISFCLRDDSFLSLLENNPSPAEFLEAIKRLEDRLDKV